MRQLYRKMTPGGHVFTSAPAVNMQHMTPIHFQHFTPMGIAAVFQQAGFEVLHVGQYGNRVYEEFVLKHHVWPDCRELAAAMPGGELVNEKENPDQVWILARKPPKKK